jgi:Iron-containing redox enzyme
MDEVRGLLFTILVEELGGGNPQLNHANVYTELLHSVGVFLPDVGSREYADNPDLLDSAFTRPVFQLVVSQFPQAYFPELLGMTQYQEWSAVELKNMVRLAEYVGLDPHFYELHVAADNAATGHGAIVKRAVQLYLEQTRITAGEAAMQDHWERIWTGYVAFATTGTLAEDMRRKRLHPSTPADRVAAMVAERAPRARLNHGKKRLAGRLINDLFADADQLMTALLDDGMIVPGDPDSSPFFELLASGGPMYKIFTDAEITTWKEWVRSMPGQPADQGDEPDTDRTADPAQRMASLIDAMRLRQQGEPAHAAEHLTGLDPASPDQMITQSVAWWFRQPTAALMQALANKDNGWVVPGDPEASPLVTERLRGEGAMARALAGEAPGGNGATWIDVVTEWIKQECPIPAVAEPDGVRPLSLLTPPERVAAHPTGRIRGAGSVH